MSIKSLGLLFKHELETEVVSTRKCLERIPENLFDYKPHERTMPMNYLALIIADLPNWVAATVEDSEVDFATYKRVHPKTTAIW